MDELVFLMVFLAATAWIAVRAFQNPKGACRRSMIGFVLGVLAAVATWALADPMISNEAEFGAFVLFCGFVALCAVSCHRRLYGRVPAPCPECLRGPAALMTLIHQAE